MFNNWYFTEKMQRLPVLMYHDIHRGEPNGNFSIHWEALSLQLNYLCCHGYHTISVRQLLNYVQLGIALPEKPVLLTFDDGYKSVATCLYSLLQKYSMKATVFIVPGFVEEREQPENRYLSRAEIKGMPADLIEWGLHSYNHNNYKVLTPTELAYDITMCTEWFLSHGIPFAPALAFPYGAFPKHHRAKRKLFFGSIHAAGVKISFRIGNRMNYFPISNEMMLQRMDITGNETLPAFGKLLKEGKKKKLIGAIL